MHADIAHEWVQRDIREQNSEMYFTQVHKYSLICFPRMEYRPDTNPRSGTQDISKRCKDLKKKKVKCIIYKENEGDWNCFKFNF